MSDPNTQMQSDKAAITTYTGVITDYNDKYEKVIVKVSDKTYEEIEFDNKNELLDKRGLSNDDLINEPIEITKEYHNDKYLYYITKFEKYKGKISSYNKKTKLLTISPGKGQKNFKINFNITNEIRQNYTLDNKNLKGKQVTYRLITSEYGFEYNLLSIE
jgi:hypothetical protein